MSQERIALKATEQPVDTGTAAGKAFLDMLGVFAEFETNLRRDRQLEGIVAGKARGIYKGRKPSIDAGEVLRLHQVEKLGPAAIARRLVLAEPVFIACSANKLPAGRTEAPMPISTTAGVGAKFVVSNGFGGPAADAGGASATRGGRPRGQAAGPRPGARADGALPAQ